MTTMELRPPLLSSKPEHSSPVQGIAAVTLAICPINDTFEWPVMQKALQ